MIRGIFARESDGRITAFELTGHADAGPYGSDIVCSAVSALAITTVNGIEALAGFEPLVETNQSESGYLKFVLLEKITQEQSNIAQILLESFLLGVQAIQTEYPDYISIQTTNQKQ